MALPPAGPAALRQHCTGLELCGHGKVAQDRLRQNRGRMAYGPPSSPGPTVAAEVRYGTGLCGTAAPALTKENQQPKRAHSAPAHSSERQQCLGPSPAVWIFSDDGTPQVRPQDLSPQQGHAERHACTRAPTWQGEECGQNRKGGRDAHMLARSSDGAHKPAYEGESLHLTGSREGKSQKSCHSGHPQPKSAPAGCQQPMGWPHLSHSLLFS